MVDCVGVVTDDAFPVLIGERLMVLAVRVGVGEELGAELLERRHFRDLQTLLDSSNEYLDIQRIVEMIGFNDWMMEWIRRVKRNPASTFWMMKNWNFFVG